LIDKDKKKKKELRQPEWFSVLKIIYVLQGYSSMLCTPLEQKVRKNHAQLDMYIVFMIKLGYISERKVKNKTGDKEKQYLSATQAGIQILKKFEKQFQKWIIEEQEKENKKKDKL